MASKWLPLVLAVPGLAQVQVQMQPQGNAIVRSPMMFSTGGPSLTFDTRSEPGPAPFRFSQGMSSRTVMSSLNGGFAGTHRYFYDDVNHTYFGYDVVIMKDPQQPDTFLVTVFDLGIGPMDFAYNSQPFVPTEWKKLPPPAYPQPKIVKTGDTVDVTVWEDAASGVKIIDRMHVEPMRGLSNLQASIQTGMMGGLGGGFVGGGPIGGIVTMPGMPMRNRTMEPPTVSGTARNFSAEDGELRLNQPAISMDGHPAEGTGFLRQPSVSGQLVWFYIPHKGRFVLSLAPRESLGFVKAGEVRGGVISFEMDGTKYKLETFTPIATGVAPYNLWVLQDKEWEPTVANQVNEVRIGSVSPDELALLAKK